MGCSFNRGGVVGGIIPVDIAYSGGIDRDRNGYFYIKKGGNPEGKPLFLLDYYALGAPIFASIPAINWNIEFAFTAGISANPSDTANRTAITSVTAVWVSICHSPFFLAFFIRRRTSPLKVILMFKSVS